MPFPIIGAAISAALGLIGAKKGQEADQENMLRQEALQKEFAQNGIQWKVDDAKKAGIHPLYALGANTVSYSPNMVGSTLSSDFANVGQNIGRALESTRTGNQKADAFERTVQALTLQKMGLENEVLASQLRVINAGNSPDFPGGNRLIPGQGNSPVAGTTTYSGGGGAITVNVNPKNTQAQDAENQYGEIGGELFGLPSLIDDFLTTHTGFKGPTELGRAIRDAAIAQRNATFNERRKKYQPKR